jgi:hypothetical protein
MAATIMDVSGVARRRREIWGGGVALRVTGLLFFALLPQEVWSSPDGQPFPGAWGITAVVGFVVGSVLARRLSRGDVFAGRAAVLLAAVVAVLQVLAIARFAGLVGQVSVFTVPLVVVSAWIVRSLAEAARSVLRRPLRWLDAVVLDAAIPVLAMFAVAVGAAAAVVQVKALDQGGRESASAQWALVSLAAAGYLQVCTIVQAQRGRCRVAARDHRNDPAEAVARITPATRRVRFMQQSAVGMLAVFFLVMILAPWPLITLAAAAEMDIGPIVLPLVLFQAWLGWRFGTWILRMLGRLQVLWRTHPLSSIAGAPDVLYLRPFPMDRWRVRAVGIRYPSGWYGRPRLEEVLLRPLWGYGTVRAAESTGAFASFAGPVGAAKSTLAAESWHVTLVQWMRDAQLIVAIGGPTGGLLWELQQLQQLGLQNRLFFVIPPVSRRSWRRQLQRAEDMAASWAAVCEMVGLIPGVTVPASIDLRRTRAVILGTQDDGACVIVSDGSRDFEYEAAVQCAANVCLRRPRLSSAVDQGDAGPSVPPPHSSADDDRWRELPEQIQLAMSSPSPIARHWSIQWLHHLAAGPQRAASAAAVRGLERLANDANQWVMTAARRALAVLGATPPPPAPFAANPPPAPRGGPPRRARLESPLWLWASGLAVAVSIAVGGVTFYTLTHPAPMNLPRIPVPGQGELVFDTPGRYTLYYEGRGAVDETVALPPVTLSLSRRDDNVKIHVQPYDHFSSRTFGGYSGRAIGTAEVTVPGRYLLRAAVGTATPRANIFVEKESAEANALTWLFLAAIIGSPLGFIAGVFLFIVAVLVRGRAAEARPSVSRSPPVWQRGTVPGWYIDPQRRYQLRYWDGQTWTVHAFHDGAQLIDHGQSQPAPAPSDEQNQ